MDKSKEKISFVIPCYNSTNTIEIVIDEITNVTKRCLKEYDYEIILVNDGSPNGTTFNKIVEMAYRDNHIKGIDLSRNFGQPNAVMAAINYSSGDYIVCGDDDGETPFSELPRMIEKLNEGYDVVEAKYVNKDVRGIKRRIGSFLNGKMQEVLIGKPKDLSLTTFWIIKKYIAEEMCNYKNSHPYIGGLIIRNTNSICNVEVERRTRINGSSGYNLRKMMELWINGFTIFSTKPLRIVSHIGMIVGACGIIMAIYTVIHKLLYPSTAAGYTSLMAVILVLFGVLFFILGIFGEYIGQTYVALNNAPQFVVREKVNFDE